VVSAGASAVVSAGASAAVAAGASVAGELASLLPQAAATNAKPNTPASKRRERILEREIIGTCPPVLM